MSNIGYKTLLRRLVGRVSGDEPPEHTHSAGGEMHVTSAVRRLLQAERSDEAQTRMIVDDGFSILDDASVAEALDAFLHAVPDAANPGAGSATHADRVLSRAVETGLLTSNELEFVQLEDGRLDWRRVAECYSDRADDLRELAATLYGFRSVLICQVSTLVQADLLKYRTPADDWVDAFDLGCIPVVEHGTSPTTDGMLLLGSADPTDKRVRSFADRSSFAPSRLVYAKQSLINSLQDLLTDTIPEIAASVRRNDREVMQIVRPDGPSSLGRAA